MARASEPRWNNRAGAVALSKAGFAIIPLVPRSKYPAFSSPHPKGSPERGRCRGECGRTGHGFYDASTDSAWVDRHWGEHPDHGVAARPCPDQFVLDVDPRHGGDIGLAGLEARHGALPETFTVISGRGDGGRHLWFSGVAGPVRSRLCPGVDVISHSKGVVVMPPSVHGLTGLAYRFQTPVAGIAAAPAWLRDLVGRSEPTGILSRPRRRLSPSQARRQGRGLVAVVAGAPEGQRHIALYWAARRAAEEGLLDADGCMDVTLADAARRSGLYDHEIEHIIGDAVAAARPIGVR